MSTTRTADSGPSQHRGNTGSTNGDASSVTIGPPASAKDPRGFARVAIFGVLWSLALIALAVVAGHDILAYAGAISEQAWLEQLFSAVDGESPDSWWWVAGSVVAIVVGLALVLVALLPRPYIGLRVRAKTGVFLLDRGLRRLGAASAEDVDGVDSAKASLSGRRLRVEVYGLAPGRDRELEDRVTDVVTERLQPIERAPRVRARDRGRG